MIRNPYKIHYPHDKLWTEEIWKHQHYYQVISIDPGEKNYAIRIERRYYNTVETIIFEKIDLNSYSEVRIQGIIVQSTYKVLTEFLNKFSKFYDQCHLVVIERQMACNYKALRIMQHSITYFMTKLYNSPLLPWIIELDPKVKSKVLQMPKNVNTKTWSVKVAKELLTLRKDYFSLKVLESHKKQDDLCDTVCQIEALFKILKLPCLEETS